MQFFEHQDQARGRTTLLIVLFVMAVLALGLASAGATHLALTWHLQPGEPVGVYHRQMVTCAAIFTWGVIFLGSAFKMTTLRGGGARVAESLGGTLMASNAQEDALVRRTLNIVEEMAIAASLPVPPLYVLRHESGINAFAAGWSIDDAVIGVTQGAIEQLNRDQLQGVIAHEFSHILNRDCALNMKLLGVLHGIVVISAIGRVVMSFTSSSRHTSTKREGGAIQIFLIGAAIWLFGSIGVLIARLIQSAVSQQREYLADASAVQFTRNPAGLAGALAKIGSQSSALSTPYAADSSHMLISSPAASGFSGILSSHPPLFERITRIVPGWNGDFQTLARGTPKRVASKKAPQHETTQPTGWMDEAGLEGNAVPELIAEAPHLIAEAPHLIAAAKLLETTSDSLGRAAREPFSARALFGLWMLDDTPEGRQQQLSRLRTDLPLYQEVQRLQDAFWALPTDEHLPLFDLCLASLASLSPPQRKELGELISELRAHLSTDAFRAYCLGSIVLRHLDADATHKRRTPQMLVKAAVETTIAILARRGHESRAEAEAAFAKGCQFFSRRGKDLNFPPDAELSVQRLDAALVTLSALPAKTRQSLLDACEMVARHDQIIEPAEAELLRVIAVSLDVATPLRANAS